MGKCNYYKSCAECMAVSSRMLGDDKCDLIENATALTNAHYRPEAEVKAEAAKEFAEKLRNKIESITKTIDSEADAGFVFGINQMKDKALISIKLTEQEFENKDKQ